MAEMPDLKVKVSVEEDDGAHGSSGIGILILGVFVVWVWGAICGWLLTWLFLKS